MHAATGVEPALPMDEVFFTKTSGHTQTTVSSATWHLKLQFQIFLFLQVIFNFFSSLLFYIPLKLKRQLLHYLKEIFIKDWGGEGCLNPN